MSWNAVIAGYGGFGFCEKSVDCYKMMLSDGRWVSLNRITFSTMVSLASSNGLVGLGKQVHGPIVRYGFGDYVFVGSLLVEMYGKEG